MAWRRRGDKPLSEPINAEPIQRRIYHDDVIKWKHFQRYWPFVRGIHRSPVNSLHKGQWRGALMFSLICAWINGLINNREAGDLRRHRAHYDVIVMMRHYEGVELKCQSFGKRLIDCPSLDAGNMRVRQELQAIIIYKHFPHYWSFLRESTGDWWFSSQRASNAELWYCPCCSPERAVE